MMIAKRYGSLKGQLEAPVRHCLEKQVYILSSRLFQDTVCDFFHQELWIKLYVYGLST